MANDTFVAHIFYMKSLYLILLIASVTVMSACSKSNSAMNGEYVADYGITASVKMYAASGEVKDQEVIRQYISARKLTDRYFPQQRIAVDESQFSLTVSGDKLTIKRPGLINGEQSSKKIDAIRHLVTWKGQVRVMIPDGVINVNSKCADLSMNLLLYPVQQLDYQLTPGITGFKASYIPGVEYAIDLKPGAVTIPFLTFTASHDEVTQSCIASDAIFNVLKEAGATGLQSGDTILIQESTLHLRKK